MFNVYVDADSFSRELISIVLKRLMKESAYIGEAVFVSDRVLPSVRDAVEAHTHALREEARESITDKSGLRKIKSNIRQITVETGANSADDRIVEIAALPGFCITHDVPLSARLCEKGFPVIDDRGHVYTRENVGERLSSRNFYTELREYGIQSEKTRRMSASDINQFSSSFDRIINQMKAES